VPKEQLTRPRVPGWLVDQSRPGSPQRKSAEQRRVETDAGDPLGQQASHGTENRRDVSGVTAMCSSIAWHVCSVRRAVTVLISLTVSTVLLISSEKVERASASKKERQRVIILGRQRS
jgi:hypothetical protein